MTLISQINEAVNSSQLIEERLQYLADSSGLGIGPINEAVTQFLRNFVNRIEGGEFKPREGEKDEKFHARKDKVISIFAAIDALTDINTALAFQKKEPDPENPDVEVEGEYQTSVPLGSVLKNFYGKNGEEAHKVAQAELIEIGKRASDSLLQKAADMVDNPEGIRAYASKLQTSIEPVMNKLLSTESKQAEKRMADKTAADKEKNMARPMQGMLPRRSGA